MKEKFHKEQDEKQSRREFIFSLTRYSMLGILVSTTGVLIAKRRGWLGECIYPDEEKVTVKICRSCRILEDCELPVALETKENLAGDKYAG